MANIQPHLPGLARADKKPRLARVSEKDLERQVDEALAALGYERLILGGTRPRVRCPACTQSFHPGGYQGNTPGTPDRMYRHPAWPQCLWAAIELKGEKTAVRATQQAMQERGGTVIVHTVVEALSILSDIEEELRRLVIGAAEREAIAQRQRRIDFMLKGLLLAPRAQDGLRSAVAAGEDVESL